MKALTSFFLSFVSILILLTGQPELPKTIIKKIDMEVQKNFPGISIEKVLIDTLDNNIGSNNGYQFEAFYLKHNKEKIGTLFFTQAIGRFSLFDFLVIFDNESVIKKVKVLTYRSINGGEIAGRGFIKQFENKPGIKYFGYGKEINGISGATISGKAITKEINRLYIIVKKLNEE